ncbi:NADP-dependent oxidoreductase [Zavarzinia sp. CC-PAN008]|uniref:NADP-dependent oxidoreductase n=1 Tax=Zavarzinia sp. CC-PAN008 TaxID=3243332 RepID=UPI003F7468B1
MSNVNRQIVLAARPEGMPTASNFRLEEAPVPDLGENDVLVQNLYMSVDPYMRGRMVDRASYVPPFQIGEALTGGAIGRVAKSRNPKFKEGDIVGSMLGWREWAHVPGGEGLAKHDPNLAPISTYLGVLGMPGMTAWAGLMNIGKPKAGETVFVSAASGAVGSVVGQIAKLKGCRVIGSVGSKDKLDHVVNDLGFDAAFNYKDEDPNAALARLAPKGVDIYFENVGGSHLTAALNAMNPFGRIALCGMIEQYNATTAPAGPSNLINMIPKRITMTGFIVSDHFDQMGAFLAEVGPWVKEGKLKYTETVHDGIANAPAAFLGLFSGENKGKMLVKLA